MSGGGGSTTLAEGGAGVGARAPLMAPPRGLIVSRTASCAGRVAVMKPVVGVTAMTTGMAVMTAVKMAIFMMIEDGVFENGSWSCRA